jgi:hypothetical protein
MLYRKPVLAVLLGLIFLSFFGTLCASALMFPETYDWRYRVISNLLSPRDNPGHYWLPACGMALAALFMLRNGRAFTSKSCPTHLSSPQVSKDLRKLSRCLKRLPLETLREKLPSRLSCQW